MNTENHSLLVLALISVVTVLLIGYSLVVVRNLLLGIISATLVWLVYLSWKNLEG